jgi:capsular polysaccharide biosynthesis protein
MMPVSDQDSPDRLGGLGSAASQLGGLASLAGLSSGSSGSVKVEAVAILTSEALTERYIQTNNLLPVLYEDKWDSKRLKWKTNDPRKMPTLWKANRYFRDKIRNVTENAKTGLVSLTITWTEPREAARWANDLVIMTNDYLRTKAINEAERNIAFLQEQSKSNNVLSLQQAISSLTEAQLKKVMLARGREQYALKVLDPATVSEKQSYPQRAIWIPSAFAIGLFLSIVLVLLRASGTTSSAGSPQGSATKNT